MRNIFEHWDDLKKELSGKYTMLFLDYDGTLTPIVSTPGKAFISQEVKELLIELSRSPKCKLAIISGRALKDIKNKVGLKNIIYVGNHGLEIEGPKIKFASPISPRCRAGLEHIKSDLTQKLYSIKGAILEDKGLSISIHYRLVDKKDIQEFLSIFNEISAPYIVRGKIKVNSGKKVYEIRPPVMWDKGKVVLWLLARQQFLLEKNKILPVYIGDDVTDEDAFRALKKKGLTIFVGEQGNSEAQYYLKTTEEVTEFLRLISDLKRK
ncbi:MAG: trehalose-phosphatase [Candidatus Omnitrophica bacterium CG23_combo_of_CG06-09_8_20_14_all_40_11]|nr:MAG: trehalose-phosphatase [Candidatus Omnitrophica bacterium CG23_combo_of_CG06-09_8_20_14_all_40_11]